MGYTSYDTVRYVYRDKLPFGSAPSDDRVLPDIHLGLYTEVVVFDHATKLAYVVTWVDVAAQGSTREAPDARRSLYTSCGWHRHSTRSSSPSPFAPAPPPAPLF